ncbi:MAG: IS200/IS605 family transposase [Acidobacteriota bacterium]
MPQSLAQVYLHIIFSTKHRKPWLQDRSIRQRTYGLIGDIGSRLRSPPQQVGGVADHVHILCSLSRTITIAELVKEIKRESSLWIKAESRHLDGFEWQNGYGAFSVSPKDLPEVTSYIRYQERHHRIETYTQEVRRLLVDVGRPADQAAVFE